MPTDPDLPLLARRWGATAVPFGQVNPQDWLDTPAIQAAFTALSQAAALRSVLLLSGPNGVGKSALAGRWLRQLDSRLFQPLCLTQATLSGTGILSALATRLGKPLSFRRERTLQFLQEAFAELEHRIPVLLLDEAQNLSSASLEEVRLLLGLNLPEQPAFALILLGDEYLLNTLKLRHQRALFSRLSAHLTLPLWTPAQCAQYLLRGLEAVGLSSGTLEAPASDLLASASGGVPRSLCLLARAAWIAAATQGAQRVTPAHVQDALRTVPCVPGLLQAPVMAPADPRS
jgi:type II secretory pathway predicted ATPase ExeA